MLSTVSYPTDSIIVSVHFNFFQQIGSSYFNTDSINLIKLNPHFIFYYQLKDGVIQSVMLKNKGDTTIKEIRYYKPNSYSNFLEYCLTNPFVRLPEFGEEVTNIDESITNIKFSKISDLESFMVMKELNVYIEDFLRRD